MLWEKTFDNDNATTANHADATIGALQSVQQKPSASTVLHSMWCSSRTATWQEETYKTVKNPTINQQINLPQQAVLLAITGDIASYQ